MFVGCSNTESDNELQPANVNNSTLSTDNKEKTPGEYEITIQYENKRYGYTSGQNDEVKARYSLGENIPTNFTRTVELLQSYPPAILSFDENLFTAIVERIKADDNGNITFVLKGGLNLKESVGVAA